MKYKRTSQLLSSAALFLAVLLSACSSKPQVELINVFAASSLTDAFEEIGSAFEEENQGVEIRYNFAGSSILSTQLLEGAPANIFASANPIQMQRVMDQGFISREPILFATNKLTIIVPSDNPGNIFSFEDLAKPDISLILAAPGVPVREYSNQVIANYGNGEFQAAVYQNLVSEEENVRFVVSKVALGEVDAGIVYISDLTPEITALIIQVEIPEDANIVAVYLMAELDEASNPKLTQTFFDFVLSPKGQEILQKWGFGSRP